MEEILPLKVVLNVMKNGLTMNFASFRIYDGLEST